MNVCTKLQCLSPVKPFHPSLMFARMAGALPSGATIYVRIQGLSTNIIHGCKVLPGANTLSFLRTFINDDLKQLYHIVPNVQSF